MVYLNDNHNVPIYEQIVRQIKEQIISEKLPQGEMLPSMRKLARSLQISVITVQKAYGKLQNENYIETVLELKRVHILDSFFSGLNLAQLTKFEIKLNSSCLGHVATATNT